MDLACIVKLQNRNSDLETLSVRFSEESEPNMVSLAFEIETRQWSFITRSSFYIRDLSDFIMQTEKRDGTASLFSYDESVGLHFSSNGNLSYVELIADPLDEESRDEQGAFHSGMRRLAYCDGLIDLEKYGRSLLARGHPPIDP